MASSREVPGSDAGADADGDGRMSKHKHEGKHPGDHPGGAASDETRPAAAATARHGASPPPPADLPKITAALMERGYSAEDCRKILGGNLLRVFAEVEQVSKQLKAETRPRLSTKQAGEQFKDRTQPDSVVDNSLR